MIGAFVSRCLSIALLAVLSLSAITPLSAQDGPTHIYVLQADMERIGSLAEEGRYITDARIGFDPWSNQPVVTVDFDKEGTRMLAEFTSAHVLRPMAIVIDGKIISAPTITEPILTGRVQISGNFTHDGANELAIMLRSAALPVPFVLVEERVAQ